MAKVELCWRLHISQGTELPTTHVPSDASFDQCQLAC